VEQGWDKPALHLFKGKGGAPAVTCLGLLHLGGEEHQPAEQHHVLREWRRGWGSFAGHGSSWRGSVGNVLAWCEGTCTILLQLLISPCVRGCPRAGCLLLGRKDPSCIHYREVAAISYSGRSQVFFSLQDPFGEVRGGSLLGWLPSWGNLFYSSSALGKQLR